MAHHCKCSANLLCSSVCTGRGERYISNLSADLQTELSSVIFKQYNAGESPDDTVITSVRDSRNVG